MAAYFVKSEEQLREQCERIRPSLDERGRREWAASEAMALGFGGIALVNRATGLALMTIRNGMDELRERDGAEVESPRRIRRPGAGRPTKLSENPELLDTLESLVEPEARGDPQSPLRWTLKSLRVLAAELAEHGYTVSYRTVGHMLKKLGYSLQGNVKKLEGAQHVDRDEQFHHIANRQRAANCRRGAGAVGGHEEVRPPACSRAILAETSVPVSDLSILPDLVKTADFDVNDQLHAVPIDGRRRVPDKTVKKPVRDWLSILEEIIGTGKNDQC